jgi:hypothetical protein
MFSIAASRTFWVTHPRWRQNVIPSPKWQVSPVSGFWDLRIKVEISYQDQGFRISGFKDHVF